MSPEALKMNEERHAFKVGRAADVWSLGCILYELVYNRLPFAEMDWLHMIQAIVDPRYEIDFPERPDFDALQDVMKRCLQRDPRDRPQISELLRHRYITFGFVDFRGIETNLLSFILMVQDEYADCDFDGEEGAVFLEEMTERFRRTEAISFGEME
jgi:serine/threonine protein kinase